MSRFYKLSQSETYDNFLIDHFITRARFLQSILREGKVCAVIAVNEKFLPPIQENLSERRTVPRLAQLTMEAYVDLREFLDAKEDAIGVFRSQ